MKCANCGAEIKLGCVYCSVCGKEAQIVPVTDSLLILIIKRFLMAVLHQKNNDNTNDCNSNQN